MDRIGQDKRASSLMQRALDRRASLARSRFKLEPKQMQQILISYLEKQNSKPYQELVLMLKQVSLTDNNLEILLEDCINCIDLLGVEASQLVEAICMADWTIRSLPQVEAYTQWTLDLLTVHIYHAPIVMAALLNQFQKEGEMWEEEPPIEITTSWSHVHIVIAKIVAIIPMSSEILLQKAIERYPYYKRSSYTNRAYVYNLIWITKYLPSITEQLICLIVSRLIILDVNVKDMMQQPLKLEGELFSMDMEPSKDPDLATTLDYCMLEMLHWVKDSRNETIDMLCRIFERILLPTYGTRHIQFLIFYAVSLNDVCAERVLSLLWSGASGLRGTGGARGAAAAHLAGLLARGRRLGQARLLAYLRLAADWAHSYLAALNQSAADAAAIAAKPHAAFHAICHAVFYLVAFKHHELFEDKKGVAFVESLNLGRLVSCPLNPLRTCSAQVTRAFAGVTRAHQVAYCLAVVERNARHTLSAVDTHFLQHWFPYDPYTLPRSGKLISPLYEEYKEWSGENSYDNKNFADRIKMEIKMETEDDDYLATSPASKLSSSFSNGSLPGFKFY